MLLEHGYASRSVMCIHDAHELKAALCSALVPTSRFASATDAVRLFDVQRGFLTLSDAACCAMAVQVFQEIHRVLKPGGKAYMSFSNRCFPTKGGRCATHSADCAVVQPHVAQAC